MREPSIDIRRHLRRVLLNKVAEDSAPLRVEIGLDGNLLTCCSK